jgi:hypothetical protein
VFAQIIHPIQSYCIGINLDHIQTNDGLLNCLEYKISLDENDSILLRKYHFDSTGRIIRIIDFNSKNEWRFDFNDGEIYCKITFHEASEPYTSGINCVNAGEILYKIEYNYDGTILRKFWISKISNNCEIKQEYQYLNKKCIKLIYYSLNNNNQIIEKRIMNYW